METFGCAATLGSRIAAYLLITALLWTVMLLYLRIARRYTILDKPNARSSHHRVTLNGGGIIFYVGMLIWLLCSGFAYPYFFIGLSLVAFVSFMDDLHPVSRMLRLSFHIIAVIFLFVQLKMYDVSWYTFLFFTIVYVGFINVYNFMDGINGLTGGYSLVAVGSFWYINNYIRPFIDNPLLYVVGLSLLVFLFFNFRRKAVCFAGDVGAVSMAFILLLLLVRLILFTADFSYFILFVLYGADGVLTILHRLLLRENILTPHRRHVYQMLVNELGFPHIKVSLCYMLLQAVIFAGYVSLREYKYWYLGSVAGLLIISYVLFICRYSGISKQVVADKG